MQQANPANASVIEAVRARLVPMRPDQSTILRHRAKTKVLAMGRRWGKSKMGTTAVLAAAAAGAKVAWVVPTYKNGRPLWREAENVVAPLKRSGRVEINRSDRTILFPGGGFLGVYSADNDTAIRGDWFNLVVVDEAARIAEDVWTDTIQPTLADADGDAILISTPAGQNWFWREWQRGALQMDGEVASFRAPTSDNPMPTIRRAADLARTRVPDTTYRQEWLAEFVEEANQPFSRDWWREARFNPLDNRLWNASVARFISWDTALEDTDTAAYSACVVGELTEDYRLMIREVWRDKLTFPNLVQHIERMAAKWGAQSELGMVAGRTKLQNVIIESKVSGISAFQTLREAGDPELARLVTPYKPQGSKEARAELAAVWCKAGCVWLPDPSADVPWLFAMENELFSFPESDFQDQVDAFTQLVLFTSKLLREGMEARQRAAEQLAAVAVEEQEVAA